MWKCPKCGREFKKNNQNHFCGEKPKTIEEYINNQDIEKQADLFLIREILHSVLIEAEERISWSIPTYWKNNNIIHFSAAKNHIGLYVGENVVTKFHQKSKAYCINKGTIYIPYGKVDSDLIKMIAQLCWEENK